MKGAYVLLLALDEKNILIISSKKFDLEGGVYAYVGSAKGPGGLGARVGRHIAIFKGCMKKAHWHIDRLLPRASSLIAMAVGGDGASECAVVRCLKSSGFTAVRGFGSTDCREGCGGHLLRFGGRTETSEGEGEKDAMGLAAETAKEAIKRIGLE